jgi:choline dehydrogenase-like flavoprotein
MQTLLGHKVLKYKLQNGVVKVFVQGKSCSHIISTKRLCLAAGVVGTPEILWRSKAAKAKDFTFSFHAMMREAAVFPKDVNDLHDIDPHQVWSNDSKRKIGAAVGTPQLLASTLATKNVAYDGDLSRIGTYYISTPFRGKSGMIPFGGTLVPYFKLDKAMKRELNECALLLRQSLINVGGSPLGELNSSISTVHVFSSLPLGKTKVLDKTGFVKGSKGRVFVRDSSILPSPPLVNPQGPLMQMVTALEAKRSA